MEDNLICFNYIINLKDNKDPEAWWRILDAFINAVERENAGACGGMHPLSSNKYCEACKDAQGTFETPE